MTNLTTLTEFIATRQEIQAGVETIAPQPDPAQKLAQLEEIRRELILELDHAESRRRETAHRLAQLKEEAWSVCATSQYRQVDKSALRRLANLIDFPGWHEL